MTTNATRGTAALSAGAPPPPPRILPPGTIGVPSPVLPVPDSPPPGPVPAPPARAAAFSSSVVLALAVAAVIVTQAIATLHAFPASQSITIAIIVLGGLLGAITGVEQILAQQSAATERLQTQQHAHELTLARLTKGEQ